jgi:SAM-dependent methyltransferase
MTGTEPIRAPSVVETLHAALAEIAQARAYNAWLFERARPQLGRRVLDFGAGVGTFTDLAAGMGAQVVAAEPEAEFARFLRERFAGNGHVRVVQGTIDEVDEHDFESVICFNVLEHVQDDGAALRSVAGRLVPGGRLFLLVPAHPSLYGGYDRAAGHYRRYSERPLRDFLMRVGFEVEKLRYVNPVGAIGWFLRVRLRSSSVWPSGSFAAFDRLVPLLRPLDRVRFPFGLSLWAVARRPLTSSLAIPEGLKVEGCRSSGRALSRMRTASPSGCAEAADRDRDQHCDETDGHRDSGEREGELEPHRLADHDENEDDEDLVGEAESEDECNCGALDAGLGPVEEVEEEPLQSGEASSCGTLRLYTPASVDESLPERLRRPDIRERFRWSRIAGLTAEEYRFTAS